MADTSSIGPQWPPRESSYARIKGIDNRGVVASAEHLEDLLGRLQSLAEGLGSGDAGIDRLSIRALFDDRLLETAKSRLEPWAEAIIPLEGCGAALEGRTFVYLGYNAETRQCDPEDLARAIERMKVARAHGPRSAAAIMERARAGGYDLRILDRRERTADPRVQSGMSALYERFGWSPQETRQILANPDSLIAVASLEEEGQPSLVSAGIAELSHIRFGDGAQMRIAEFTEAATDRSHRGRGLYSGIVTLLMAELARRSRASEILGGTLDMAFGECSGSDQGVLIAARHLGRELSATAAEERGLPYPGLLRQHVPIAGAAPRSTPYNDFFPTFIGRDRLYRFVDGALVDGA